MSQPNVSRTAREAGVRPPYQVRPLTIEDGMEMAMWSNPGPWAVQDDLQPPRPDEGYWAVEDAGGQFVGFCCLGEAARVPGLAADSGSLDVALGLRPDLVGHRLSPGFARGVVAHARTVAEGRRLRCVVALWNGAGRKAAEAAGFKVTGSHEVPGGAAVSSYLVLAQR